MDSIVSRIPRQRPVSRKHKLALTKKALEYWLCWHAAGPEHLIPHILGIVTEGQCDDAFIEALSKAASDWTERHFSYRPEDIDLVLRIAEREAKR
jgi:hypothetical protein